LRRQQEGAILESPTRKVKMNEKIVVEFEEEEIDILGLAVSMYLQMTGMRVTQHKMYKEESMDRLFKKMDAYASTGVLWSKLMKAQGIPQEAITEYLERVRD
jgi:hypothetical protein